MIILAIDPGNEKSAWVLYDAARARLVDYGITLNGGLASKLALKEISADYMACEMIASYGMAVGATVFETCVWIGRFIETWGRDHTLVYRKDVKMHLCNSMKAKDANIRQAVMDRYGSSKEKAIGTKKNPGPLYGVSKDVWSALAIAITYSEKHVIN
jgi:hypothetical protein